MKLQLKQRLQRNNIHLVVDMSFFESVSSIVKNLSDFYSEINSATLTGAIDVIVVEQEDGSLKSSPFHVKFGKLGVLKAREKIVSLF